MISSSKINRTALWRISLLLSIVGFLLCYGAFYLANKLSVENMNSQLLTLDQGNKHIGLIVQENAEQVIANADTVLRFMQRDVELHGKILPEHEAILREFCQRRFVGNTSVFDQSGELQFAVKVRKPGRSTNVAETDIFKEQLKFSPGLLYIGAGWDSLTTDQPVVFLSRQIRSAQGEFLGIVTVTLAQDYLTKLGNHLDLGGERRIILLRRDGMILAQIPQMENRKASAVNLHRDERIEEYLSRNITAAIYNDIESGVEYREFFTVLRGYPLLVEVSSRTDSAEALSVQIQQQYRIFAQIFSAFVLLSGVLLWWQIRRQYMFAEQLQQKQWQLEQLSYHDQLTGVKNRHYLDEIIAGEMARADRYKEPLSMLIFDLDHFKKVNDTWGHPVGDLVLKHTAEIIGDRIRKADILVRIGGEEFVVLMPETRLAGAREAAESLREALVANEHPIAGKVTASFGVAERMKIEPFSYWYRRADEALYRAKQGGRN
ncbi:MAG: sensor domain-containing diguanylate cyclase, partial [Selenomonadaceae bacterium]